MSARQQSTSFLWAEWRDLALVNWPVPAEVLLPLVPQGTVLDTWHGQCYASVVCFRFLKARVLGVSVPWHGAFEEVNLRFYVRRQFGKQTRRGVVFVKELAPRRCAAWVARWAYNENYSVVPMSHRIERNNGRLSVRYAWTMHSRANSIRLASNSPFQPLTAGSHEEFVTEQYFGYTRQADGRTIEYRVAHDPWQFAPASDYTLDFDPVAIYGRDLGTPLLGQPATAFLVDGSQVTVGFGRRLR